jgi:hypothetical protein
MRKGVDTQPDMFQTLVPSIDLSEPLRGKAVDLLRRLLIEAIIPGPATCEAKEELGGGDDHNQG